MRYRCEILNHGIDGYEVWLHGRNQGRSGVNDQLVINYNDRRQPCLMFRAGKNHDFFYLNQIY